MPRAVARQGFETTPHAPTWLATADLDEYIIPTGHNRRSGVLKKHAAPVKDIMDERGALYGAQFDHYGQLLCWLWRGTPLIPSMSPTTHPHHNRRASRRPIFAVPGLPEHERAPRGHL
eukprot:CAMPEP_0182566698 /NCGR_PEP_ID=MMETSP1324-20130603/8093_1 /TAXON_ID=236786 /ORGANISM="Florenciella sp., Strain RCC1587" /LENGTH=117 /DNA_ID=CAMNT_0024780543 /DNA_START=167 /DNA_END=519 /DNA_ORIENTATION=+